MHSLPCPSSKFQGSRPLTSSLSFTQSRAEAAPTISTATLPATSALNQDFSANPGGAFALLPISLLVSSIRSHKNAEINMKFNQLENHSLLVQQILALLLLLAVAERLWVAEALQQVKTGRNNPSLFQVSPAVLMIYC